MNEFIGKAMVWIGGVSAVAAPGVAIAGIWANDWRVSATGLIMFLGGCIAAGVGLALDA